MTKVEPGKDEDGPECGGNKRIESSTHMGAAQGIWIWSSRAVPAPNQIPIVLHSGAPFHDIYGIYSLRTKESASSYPLHALSQASVLQRAPRDLANGRFSPGKLSIVTTSTRQ